MSTVVIDASVAVKWFLPEVHAAAARRVLRGRRTLLAPDLIWAEVGNVMWKKRRIGEVTADEARTVLKTFRQFPLETCTTKVLLEPAWELGERLGITVYDSLYLVLAMHRRCQLITADAHLRHAVKGDAMERTLLWVEDVR